MPTIGTINFKLTAVTGQFQKEMRRSQKAIGRFGDKVKSSIGGLINFRTAIATLLGGAGLGLLVKRTLDEVDALAKAADNIGTTTQALRGLQLQANLSGVATEKLTKGVKRYLINIGDAVDGTGEAGEVLEDMGLSAKALAQLPLVDSMARFADAMNNLGTQAERANALSKLFGRTGADMAVFFRNGSKGIREAAEMAEKFGTAISRIDANKIEQANDAFRILKEQFAGIRFAAVTQLAPILTGIALRLQAIAISGQSVGDTVAFAMERSTKAVGFLADAIQDIVIAWKATQLGAARAAAKTVDFFSKDKGIDLSVATFKLNEATGVFEELGKTTKRWRNEIESTNPVIERLQKQLDSMLIRPKVSDDIARFFRNSRAQAQALAEELKDKLSFSFGDFAATLQSTSKAIKQRAGRIGFKSAKEVAFGGFNESKRLVGIQSRALKLLERIARNTRNGGAALA